MRLIPSTRGRRAVALLPRRGDRDRLHRRHDRGGRAAAVQAARPRHLGRRRRSSTPNVTLPNPGQPQTILIIGSDHRAGEPFNAANTDTMMLVRLDASSSTINVLSVPRDLEVEIPGYGTAKINSAYPIGGPEPAGQDDPQNVFPGSRSTTSSTSTSAASRTWSTRSAASTPTSTTATTTTPRVHQLLEHQHPARLSEAVRRRDALAVRALPPHRLRHRPQRPPAGLHPLGQGPVRGGNLIANRDKLLRIFGEHTQTDHDLHTVDGLINLFNLVAFSAGHTIKQIQFPAHRSRAAGDRHRRGRAVLRDRRRRRAEAAGVPRLHAADDDQRRAPSRPDAAPGHSGASARRRPPGLIADVSRRQGPGGGARPSRDAGLLPAPDRRPAPSTARA